MPDDENAAQGSQGFDWSGLLKSATPYAAALIPAAIGALAGGRKLAVTGGAAGFAQGISGQEKAQDVYQKQLAQVQEANQRAAIQQQGEALRAANLDRQNKLAEAQIGHLEGLTTELKEKKERAQLTDQNQLKWADENLTGAAHDAFVAEDRVGR